MKTSSLVVASVVRLVAVLSFFGAVAAPPANGQVSFLQPLTFNVGQGGGNGVYADFNRDGKLDIAFAGLGVAGQWRRHFPGANQFECHRKPGGDR